MSISESVIPSWLSSMATIGYLEKRLGEIGRASTNASSECRIEQLKDVQQRLSVLFEQIVKEKESCTEEGAAKEIVEGAFSLAAERIHCVQSGCDSQIAKWEGVDKLDKMVSGLTMIKRNLLWRREMSSQDMEFVRDTKLQIQDFRHEECALQVQSLLEEIDAQNLRAPEDSGASLIDRLSRLVETASALSSDIAACQGVVTKEVEGEYQRARKQIQDEVSALPQKLKQLLYRECLHAYGKIDSMALYPWIEANLVSDFDRFYVGYTSFLGKSQDFEIGVHRPVATMSQEDLWLLLVEIGTKIRNVLNCSESSDEEKTAQVRAAIAALPLASQLQIKEKLEVLLGYAVEDIYFPIYLEFISMIVQEMIVQNT